jgi:hypothetical protein
MPDDGSVTPTQFAQLLKDRIQAFSPVVRFDFEISDVSDVLINF